MPMWVTAEGNSTQQYAQIDVVSEESLLKDIKDSAGDEEDE